MDIALKFDLLISKALTEWPEKIDLTTLEDIGEGLSRYNVTGLDDIFDVIERKHIGTGTEIIQRELHTAIYSIIKDAARFVTLIELQSVRKQAVQSVFEYSIKSTVTRSDLGWNLKDQALVTAYFVQNAPT